MSSRRGDERQRRDSRRRRRHQPRTGPAVAHADVGRLREPRRRRGLGDLAGLDVPAPPGLRGQHPDHAVLGERADRVDQGVDEIAVALPPPDQDQVDDLVGVLVEQFVAAPLLDGVAHRLVDIVVPTELLDDHARLDAELARDVGRPSGIFRGNHACTPFPRHRPVPARRGRSGCGIRTRSTRRRATAVTRSRAEGHDRGSGAAPELHIDGRGASRPDATQGDPLTGQGSDDRRGGDARGTRPRHPGRARRSPARHRPRGDRRVAGLVRRRRSTPPGSSAPAT